MWNGYGTCSNLASSGRAAPPPLLMTTLITGQCRRNPRRQRRNHRNSETYSVCRELELIHKGRQRTRGKRRIFTVFLADVLYVMRARPISDESTSKINIDRRQTVIKVLPSADLNYASYYRKFYTLYFFRDFPSTLLVKLLNFRFFSFSCV